MERLFAGHFQTQRVERLEKNLADRIVAGGYPAAIKSPTDHSRISWYRSFNTSLIQKDVLDLSKIHSSDILPKILKSVAHLSGQLFNVSKIASQFKINRNTIRDYLTLLERQFLIDQLKPWHSNRMKRLVKKPKIHICDTGLACMLLGVESISLMKDKSLFGQLLETFIVQELKRQASYSNDPYEFYHFRDKDGVEVDLVIEIDSSELVGIEVKASATVVKSDFKGLRKLKAVEGSRFKFGAVLYDGEVLVMECMLFQSEWSGRERDDSSKHYYQSLLFQNKKASTRHFQEKIWERQGEVLI